MKFQENAKPIYLQIADRICDDITSGVYKPDSRIPSVREFAALMQVNVNTTMRTFEYLSTQEIIFNKRGIGYFVSPDAIDKIKEMRRETFFNDDVLYFFDRLANIGVTPERLELLYTEYLTNKK